MPLPQALTLRGLLRPHAKGLTIGIIAVLIEGRQAVRPGDLPAVQAFSGIQENPMEEPEAMIRERSDITHGQIMGVCRALLQHPGKGRLLS